MIYVRFPPPSASPIPLLPSLFILSHADPEHMHVCNYSSTPTSEHWRVHFSSREVHPLFPNNSDPPSFLLLSGPSHLPVHLEPRYKFPSTELQFLNPFAFQLWQRLCNYERWGNTMQPSVSAETHLFLWLADSCREGLELLTLT